MAFYLVLSLFLVLVGHAFRLLRWEQFIRIYERPLRGQMLRGMAGGYALNFVLPFHLGDVFRAVFTGRRMKSGIGFALATVIMDRFLDVWFVALGFGAFWALGRSITWCFRWCWRWALCWWWPCGTCSKKAALPSAGCSMIR